MSRVNVKKCIQKMILPVDVDATRTRKIRTEVACSTGVLIIVRDSLEQRVGLVHGRIICAYTRLTNDDTIIPIQVDDVLHVWAAIGASTKFILSLH